METRASYVVVGAFVLAFIAAAFGFVLFLTRANLEEPPRPYMVYFKGSVTGLQVGSPVRYRGVPVGSVTDIRIDPDNVEQVRVATEILPDTPVKTDTIATIGLQGVTGVAYIQLTGGTHESAPLRPAPGAAFAVIPSKPSGFEQVMAQAPELLERAVAISERLALLLDERNLNSVADTLENIRKLTGTVAGRTDEINQVLADSRETMSALKEAAAGIADLTAEFQGKVGPITNETKNIIAETKEAVRGFNRIAFHLEEIVEENRAPIRDFSTGGLYELSQFIAEARVLVAALTRLSGQIERDPARFFFGDTQKGFEAK